MEIFISIVVGFIILVIVRGGWSNFSKRYYNPDNDKYRNKKGDDYWETEMAGAASQGDESRAYQCASKLSDEALQRDFKMFAESYDGMQKLNYRVLSDLEAIALPILYKVTYTVMNERQLL